MKYLYYTWTKVVFYSLSKLQYYVITFKKNEGH